MTGAKKRGTRWSVCAESVTSSSSQKSGHSERLDKSCRGFYPDS